MNYGYFIDVVNVVGCLWFRGNKGGEVVFINEVLGCCLYLFNVDWVFVMVGVIVFKGVGEFFFYYLVVVVFMVGIKVGVKVWCYFCCFFY